MLDMRDHLLLPLPRSGLFPRPIAQSPNGSVWLTWFGSYEEGIGIEFFEILLDGPEPRVLAPILAKDNEAAISQANELLRSWFESGLALDQLPSAQPLLFMDRLDLCPLCEEPAELEVDCLEHEVYMVGFYCSGEDCCACSRPVLHRNLARAVQEAQKRWQRQPSQQHPAAVLWLSARNLVRAAAQAGLPPPALRAELARELASLADWLRVSGQPSARPSAKAPPAAQTVQVRRDQRRRSGSPPLQLRLDRRLWDALDQPTFLRLSSAEGLVRLLPASEADGKRVKVMGTGPFLVCSDAELALGEGVYAAHVAGGALVIGALLDDGEAG